MSKDPYSNSTLINRESAYQQPPVNIAEVRKTGVGIKEKENKISYKEIYVPFFDAIAQRMNKNKVKYPEGNFLKDLDINDLLDALQRHLNKLRFDYVGDDESKEEHLAAIGCNAMMILAQLRQK